MMPILVTPTSSVHMLWLVPQYFVMAAAEVMLSVTGLQFSYTQVHIFTFFPKFSKTITLCHFIFYF